MIHSNPSDNVTFPASGSIVSQSCLQGFGTEFVRAGNPILRVGRSSTMCSFARKFCTRFSKATWKPGLCKDLARDRLRTVQNHWHHFNFLTWLGRTFFIVKQSPDYILDMTGYLRSIPILYLHSGWWTKLCKSGPQDLPFWTSARQQGRRTCICTEIWE